MITVNFRVTGIYLGSNNQGDPFSISVEIHDNPTVFDIMNKIKDEVKQNKYPHIDSFGFSPSNPSERDTLNLIYADYKTKPRENREAGFYILIDNNHSIPLSTFQYYIFDKDFKQVNNNNFTRRFNQKPEPESEIKDGYTVVIRQLNILTEPISKNVPKIKKNYES